MGVQPSTQDGGLVGVQWDGQSVRSDQPSFLLRIPITNPPNTPPTIVPVFGEALLFSALAVVLGCARESLATPVEPETRTGVGGPVPMRVVLPATVV
jgi:hypothetical protein